MSAGQAIKILKTLIVNPQEEGARGGPALFDQVEAVPTGERGFIQRAGDDFPPFM